LDHIAVRDVVVRRHPRRVRRSNGVHYCGIFSLQILQADTDVWLKNQRERVPMQNKQTLRRYCCPA
jgi:hypothetical protein